MTKPPHQNNNNKWSMNISNIVILVVSRGGFVFLETHLRLTWAIRSSSLNHLIVESVRTLKNWHHSFKCPEASANVSDLILRITWGAGDKDRKKKTGKTVRNLPSSLFLKKKNTPNKTILIMSNSGTYWKDFVVFKNVLKIFGSCTDSITNYPPTFKLWLSALGSPTIL